MKYKTIRTASGRKYRVPMKAGEILERRIFNAAMILVPVFWMVAWCWGAGIL